MSISASVTKMYRSRENLISHVKPLELGVRIEECEQAADDIITELYRAVDNLDDAASDYFAALDEFSEDNSDENDAGVQMMALNLDDKWAEVQKHLSGYAVLMGIDGNDAYNRHMS